MYLKNMIQVIPFLFGIFLLLPAQKGTAGQERISEVAQTSQHNTPADPEKLSVEEKEWFQAFQEGTFYARGWKDITMQILEKTPHSLKSELQQTLESLGVKIGCEWSKGNEVRRIDTDMLEQWGSLLEQTAEQEPEMIPQVVASINQKVGILLE